MKQDDSAGLTRINAVSPYSFANVHEWFAEAFAGATLKRLGENQDLGPTWRSLLVFKPRHVTRYWSNYNCISKEFIEWLSHKKSHLTSSG